MNAPATSPPTDGAPKVSRLELVHLIFFALEGSHIPYAILHGYDASLGITGNDIDCAVGAKELHRARQIIVATADRAGWRLIQVWQHQLYSFYHVLIDPRHPQEVLALDLCTAYTSRRSLLIDNLSLLRGRRRGACGFFVPSAASEAIYTLVKGLMKAKDPAGFLPRVRHLQAQDVEEADQLFRKVFGRVFPSLQVALQTLSDSPSAAEGLAQALHARGRYGPLRLVAEGWRIAKRFARPTGLHIAVLGPDGAGKSTLIEALGSSLRGCFTRQRVFKFRPDVFGRIQPGTNSEPHRRAPRSVPVSWAKVLYYFADWWLGWLLVLWPARARGELVIFDRDFDDIAIDQRRYLVQGVGRLSRAMQRVIPRPAVTLVLDGDARLIHQRKPELPVSELSRLSRSYRELAASSRGNYQLISADQPPLRVAEAACSRVLEKLSKN